VPAKIGLFFFINVKSALLCGAFGLNDLFFVLLLWARIANPHYRSDVLFHFDSSGKIPAGASIPLVNTKHKKQLKDIKIFELF
jgi:hypothetical protein